jgi:hypothetical protein
VRTIRGLHGLRCSRRWSAHRPRRAADPARLLVARCRPVRRADARLQQLAVLPGRKVADPHRTAGGELRGADAPDRRDQPQALRQHRRRGGEAEREAEYVRSITGRLLKPEWLAADTAYGSASNLDWLVNEQGIAPNVPVIDKSKRDNRTFSREDFIYDEVRDIYT